MVSAILQYTAQQSSDLKERDYRDEVISPLLLHLLFSHRLGRDRTWKRYLTPAKKNHVFCPAGQGFAVRWGSVYSE